jgi:molecular chaperone GrpE
VSEERAENTEEREDAFSEATPDAESEAEAPLSLEEQLAQALAQADEYLDGWQRARAELANVKKRMERERNEMYDKTRVPVIARLLNVLDDFERAMENAPESLDGDGWFEGLMHVQRKFAGWLEAEGVTEIDAGEYFDPAIHEAISQEPSNDHEEGEIIEVVQKGYTLGDQVVRPARVRVAG